MKTTIRRIGNSFGLLIPKALLKTWGLAEGDTLEIGPEGFSAPLPRGNEHARLDALKRAIAVEVLSRFVPAEIRRRGLENLARWKAAGTWPPVYREWEALLRSDDDAALIRAMASEDEESNRLRQSPPYVGMLPKDVLGKLREAIAA
jgi:antitoxin component of MazEF toxin-antitoxin module